MPEIVSDLPDGVGDDLVAEFGELGRGSSVSPRRILVVTRTSQRGAVRRACQRSKVPRQPSKTIAAHTDPAAAAA